MYLMIGKGQIAQKGPYWGENRLKNTIKGKYKYLVVLFLKASCSGTDTTTSGKRFQYLTTMYVKLFLLLWVLTAC